MADDSAMQVIEAKIAELTQTKVLKVLEMALDGKLKDDLPLQSAKILLSACLGTREMGSSPIVIQVGSMPRPLLSGSLKELPLPLPETEGTDPKNPKPLEKSKE